MWLSTKGRYGLKAMLDLALHNGEGPVALKSIAERQNLPENYLEQLFATLKKAGHITSVRGAQGGYLLSKDPDSITIGSILRSLEGSLAPVDCVVEDSSPKCDRFDNCVTKIVWEKIRDSVNEAVDSITLGDLVKESNKNSALS
ncbi:MAG TPA: Rrf2 family transcriptional regulator [Hungateiclostridium thermocellum]|jgi:Rrf2 family cysteine metabolism transcriptional repressor|uniref:Transcriptional regulator, BadM/Rrf2 family n=2 Tax=Acetivibrio thermocellus TaxID=1515 RepID=A3DDC5_ACET2|nr:Rrf2 family transcriptional regulator [Acetivibrio thermocellus]CDG35412.1 BadM/Rrf2 family transcriptional regulator [Acetivibrio thermocellus BC1]ABN51954.1 transcriptional regulator, BadM/Rrf2 family [Acetivibrio thermocellus ATCC 27405]ADU74566.1 transcriptional regulator, BadM/Rrf2 family [Acetivibrio thermocellus DSM 1313]ALX08510.1 transcriptional regulator, BadM/Rrf2 family [Acetivibrio thermocellus AD2]ANV76259.1 transcriptional regulator, BadM/Rrf2 family [Acetivibrio thermocellus